MNLVYKMIDGNNSNIYCLLTFQDLYIHLMFGKSPNYTELVHFILHKLTIFFLLS